MHLKAALEKVSIHRTVRFWSAERAVGGRELENPFVLR